MSVPDDQRPIPATAEEGFHLLMEQMPDAVMVSRAGQIIKANSSAVALFAAETAERLVGRHILDLADTPSIEPILAHLAHPPQDGRARQYRLLRLDGEVIVVELTARTIFYRDQKARLLVLRDATECMRRHEQSIQAARLATLGEMTASLVHELAQPLNIIRLAAEGAVLMIRRGKATPDWQARQFALIAEQSERTAEIIGNVRLFSRRDAGPLVRFDAVAMVRSGAEMSRGAIEGDGFVLDLFGLDGEAMVMGRRVQLEQVVVNLITNARQALAQTAPDRPIDRRGRIAVSSRIETDHVVFEIEDNGPGIPADLRQRIFEPFFTTKTAEQGTGLGLSVSLGLIAAVGGELSVLDQGDGARFAVRLPLADDRAPGADVAIPATSVEGRGHLMMVGGGGDTAPMAEWETDVYRISRVAGTREALDLFHRDPADVVIADFRAPNDDDWLELVAVLRDFDPLLPIIIVTDHPERIDLLGPDIRDERCVALPRPLEIQTLARIIPLFLHPPSR